MRSHCADGVPFSASFLFLFFLSFSSCVATGFSDELSSVFREPTKLQLSGGLKVINSPGTRPGASVACERILIQGLSRLRNLQKYSHSWKVKISQTNSTLRTPNFEVCFHRNLSLGLGMCPPSQWEKSVKASWVHNMSPFDNRVIDIRMAGSSLEVLQISIEEEFFSYRIAFLVVGIILMALASHLSRSLVFFYSSAMAIGVILFILIILFQGMKLLPTGRKSSLAFCIYSSLVGLGTFLLRYLPRLVHALLAELGISEDAYYPLAIFLLVFVALAGAWMGFWVLRKLVLTEEGSIDTGTSHFVAWSIRILAAVMILQSTVDPILAAEALVTVVIGLSATIKVIRSKFLRRIYKKFFKSLQGEHISSYTHDILSSGNSYFEHINRSYSPVESKFPRRRSKNFTLDPCNSSVQGSTKTRSHEPSESDTFYSTFHSTPEKRRFSKDEWEEFTKSTTNKALKELVSSPDFNKWAAANADRLTLTPKTDSSSTRTGSRKWLHWF